MTPIKTPARRQRLYFIIFSMLCITIATVVILVAFRDNIVFFKTPTDIVERPQKVGEQIRLGGIVKEGSLKENTDGSHQFVVTDNKHDLAVYYKGMLPNLFREKQGVVVYGAMGGDGVFLAHEVLAKHDEKYMPREVEKAIDKPAADKPI